MWWFLHAKTIHFGKARANNACPQFWGHTGGEKLIRIPETNTWAMLLAGLGLVGFASRRRQQVATHSINPV
jgi:hypothetical protein